MKNKTSPAVSAGPGVFAGVWKGLAVLAAAAVLAGCSQEPDDDQPVLRIQMAGAPVAGATCTLAYATGRVLAEPVTTAADGSATFRRIQAAPTLGRVRCSGGTYTDAATGTTRQATVRRSITAQPAGAADSPTVVVSLLTEMAVRLLGTDAAETRFATTRAWVAGGFGLGTLDISTVPARDFSSATAGDDAESRHGLVLAALSQLELAGTAGRSPDALIDAFAANIDSTGFCKDMILPRTYASAVEAVLANSRLKPRLLAAGTPLAREIFDKAMHAQPLAVVEQVHAGSTSTSHGVVDHVIAPGAAATLSIAGRWLFLGLDVRLAGARCKLYNLKTDDHEISTGTLRMSAECPAQPAGTAQLVVRDAGLVVSQTALTVAPKTASAAPSDRRHALAGNDTGTGPVNLSGVVSALAPTVDTTTGAHNYANPRSFLVKGVVVELLDRDANNAVLLDTVTDANGRYAFRGAPAGRNVTVRVKAQLLKTRAAGTTTGAAWNVAVRDNTSTSVPKAMYVLDAAPLTTIASGDQVADVRATLGFAADGTVGSDESRQSAPFSVLEVAYSAMTKIEATDANVSFPEVNFYWSPKNVGTGGNKQLGQISTSHFADDGELPGVFILGKADADTDEFDQGVIGHELGHWLQSVLSASDNPGGSHAVGDFKDASLAYGEGYGTAVGGLLSGSPFYIDSSGVKQSGGGVTNLDQPSPSGARKGFYAEESVQYVMYQIGKRFGFTPFWQAVTALRTDHHSATLFAFLARFMAANPAAAIADLLAAENIRSSEAFGRLPVGLAADAAIAADQNKGEAAAGAGDLETLYLPVTLAAADAAAQPVNLTGASPPSFCINHNLKGARLSNGLGMLRRFSFMAPYTGNLGVKFADDKGATLAAKDIAVSARSSRGAVVRVEGWDDAVQMPVEQGVTYTLLFQQTQTNVFQGNRCGNTLGLWRMPA